MLKITIEGEAKEIAALFTAERLKEILDEQFRELQEHHKALNQLARDASLGVHDT